MTKVVDTGRQLVTGVVDPVVKCITVTSAVVNKAAPQNLSTVSACLSFKRHHWGKNHAECKEPDPIGSIHNTQRNSCFNNSILINGVFDAGKALLENISSYVNKNSKRLLTS